MGIQKDGIGIYIGILGYYSIPIVLLFILVGSVKMTDGSVICDTSLPNFGRECQYDRGFFLKFR